MRFVDLFAGFGGFSLGAMALGGKIVWAGNHAKLACDVYARNHNGFRPVCQDLRQADWRSLPDYDVLIASPACQGHSEASQPGRRAYHAEDRSTALAVIDCLDNTRPKSFVVENVSQFVEWELFPHWYGMLNTLGYKVTTQVVNAVWYGTPQLRKRLIVTGSLRKSIRALEEPTFGTVEIPFFYQIDWKAPGWRPISSCRGEGAKERLIASKRHGEIAIVQHVTGHKGLDPRVSSIRTVTTKDQWVVRRGNMYRPFTMREYARAMDFPETFTWPEGLNREDVCRGIGNAIPIKMGTAAIRRVLEAA